MSKQEQVSQEAHEEYLTTKEVALRTRTSQSFWEKLRVAGGGPRFSKPARFVRYCWSDVAEFMESRSCRSTSEGALVKRAEPAHSDHEDRTQNDRVKDDQKNAADGASKGEPSSGDRDAR